MNKQLIDNLDWLGDAINQLQNIKDKITHQIIPTGIDWIDSLMSGGIHKGSIYTLVSLNKNEVTPDDVYESLTNSGHQGLFFNANNPDITIQDIILGSQCNPDFIIIDDFDELRNSDVDVPSLDVGNMEMLKRIALDTSIPIIISLYGYIPTIICTDCMHMSNHVVYSHRL